MWTRLRASIRMLVVLSAGCCLVYLWVFNRECSHAAWVFLAKHGPTESLRADAVSFVVGPPHHGEYQPETELGVQVLLNDASPQVRAAAASALLGAARRGSRKVIFALIQALANDADDDVRVNAIVVLQRAPSLEVLEALVKATGAKSEAVRVNAISALIEMTGHGSRRQTPEDWGRWFEEHRDNIRVDQDGRLQWR